ncbi:MAG: hypothetical protein AAGJ19_13720 [Myxococcota bacterium]
MSSTKTTIVGILMILAALITGAIGFLQTGAPDWGVVGAEIIAGIGFLTARDNDKSDAAAGAK